LQLPQF